jgi:DNA-directed RNA polymerase specialized sigma24 family protein
MKIPKGMTKESVEDIIFKVIKRFRGYAFDVYSPDDIEQEAYIIALDGLSRYKSTSGSLENFLSVHIRNRMINFVHRNNNNKSDKFLINSAINLEAVSDEYEPSMSYKSSHEDELIFNETIELINNIMPVHLRMDFLKMNNGIKITKAKKDKILEIVTEFIKEYNKEE